MAYSHIRFLITTKPSCSLGRELTQFSFHEWPEVRCSLFWYCGVDKHTGSEFEARGRCKPRPNLHVPQKNPQILQPLFPCYIFARFDPFAHSIKTMPGVSYVLAFGGIPAVIS